MILNLNIYNKRLIQLKKSGYYHAQAHISTNQKERVVIYSCSTNFSRQLNQAM